MVKTLYEFRAQGTITDLGPIEKGPYTSFLGITYQDNVKASEFLLVKFPRWSIIAGYYAMHDITKLFLAKQYSLKLSRPEVHAATIQALRELIKRKDIISLLEKAEDEYDQIISLHLALLQAKDEREKTQYYTSEKKEAAVNMQKASYFLEKLVKPYLKLVKELMG
jgi:hypothetical protein